VSGVAAGELAGKKVENRKNPKVKAVLHSIHRAEEKGIK